MQGWRGTTKAAAVLVEPEFPEIAAATLRIKNPYHAFSRALGMFYQPPAYPPGIHPTAVIDPTAEIGEGAHIGAYVVIGPRRPRRAARHAVAPCCALPRREGRQPLLCPCTRSGARGLHSGRSCHARKRRDHRRGRFWILEKQQAASGRRFRSRARCGWVIVSMCRPTPASTAPRSARPKLATAAKIDNLVQVGHGSRWGKTHCSAPRLAWRGRRSSGTTPFSPGKQASPGTAAWAMASF